LLWTEQPLGPRSGLCLASPEPVPRIAGQPSEARRCRSEAPLRNKAPQSRERRPRFSFAHGAPGRPAGRWRRMLEEGWICQAFPPANKRTRRRTEVTPDTTNKQPTRKVDAREVLARQEKKEGSDSPSADRARNPPRIDLSSQKSETARRSNRRGNRSAGE
jgi:hypothetical protein